MSIQEKIDQLALAALRSAPVMSRPQPATFMLPFEKPKRVAMVDGFGELRGLGDARYGACSRSHRESAPTAAVSPWPFTAREVRI